MSEAANTIVKALYASNFESLAECKEAVQDLIAQAQREALEKAADLCEVMAGEAISEGETDVAYHDTMIVARDQIRALLPEVKE